MIAGTGVYIWNLKDCLPVSRLIAALHRMNATWVSEKIADGIYPSNQIREDGKWAGNDKFLLSVNADLTKDGISVGGWHYAYTKNKYSPGAQAGLAGERWQKLDLKHLLINAEHDERVGALWLTAATRKTDALTYMNQIKPAGVPTKGIVALNTYRFPKYFTPFPWNQFLGHASMNTIAPQMYWIGQHNPAEQLAESFAEYKVIFPDASPAHFVPAGSAFGNESWMPTTQDLLDFGRAAIKMGCKSWLFWSLDYMLNHNLVAWLDAIGAIGQGVPPPPPPPPPPPTTATFNFQVTEPTGLNVRERPDTTSKKLGSVAVGAQLKGSAILGVEGFIEIAEGEFAGKYVCAVQKNVEYIKII